MTALADEVIAALRRFRNVILEGPPGTGKTYVVNEIASRWTSATGRPLGGSGDGEYAITLHPSTSYEDFVEGLRYDQQVGAFRLRNGFITRTVIEADANPDKDYLLLLDEVNRANVPKVLGDLLLTLEPSKRRKWNGARWSGGVTVTLPYSARQFSVPDNIYVLGTMNTSDRSIAPLDAALRRRFAFVRVSPLEATELDKILRSSRGDDVANLARESVGVMTEFNKRVLRPVLGPDGELGHSYLFDIETAVVGDPELSSELQRSLQGVHRVFWTETRSGNGGSANQFDLAETGAAGLGGSLGLFYPLQTQAGVQTTPDGNRARADEFVIWYDGSRFTDNVVRYNDPTPGWRVYLQGSAPGARRLSAVANTGDAVEGHPQAQTFEYRILLWFVQDDGDVVLTRLGRTDLRMQAIRALSLWHDRSQAGAGGREFGLFDLQRLRGVLSAEPRLTWRYAILPQLVELAVANGVEELMDPVSRASWQGGHGTPADAATLQRFDQFLSSMSIWLKVVGHDLGRTLVILDDPPDQAAADEAPREPTLGADDPEPRPIEDLQRSNATDSDG